MTRDDYDILRAYLHASRPVPRYGYVDGTFYPLLFDVPMIPEDER